MLQSPHRYAIHTKKLLKKMFLGELMKPVGGKFLLHSNFDRYFAIFIEANFRHTCPALKQIRHSELDFYFSHSARKLQNDYLSLNALLKTNQAEQQIMNDNKVANEGFLWPWN